MDIADEYHFLKAKYIIHVQKSTEATAYSKRRMLKKRCRRGKGIFWILVVYTSTNVEEPSVSSQNVAKKKEVAMHLHWCISKEKTACHICDFKFTWQNEYCGSCATTYSWSKHNPIEEDTDLSDIDEVAYDSDHESDESGCLELILLNRKEGKIQMPMLIF